MCHIGEQQQQHQLQQQPIHVQPVQIQQMEQQAQLVQQVQPVQQNREQAAQQHANATLVQQAAHIPVQRPAQQAPGQPIQEERETLTFKERMERRSKAKKARKKCPVGTSLTYDIVEQLKDRKQQIQNSTDPLVPLMTQQGVDQKTISAFCHGHRAKKNHQPATPEDRMWKETDEQFIRDYCTNDLETRRPHLDRIVNEMLTMPFSPQNFAPAHMRRNAAAMKTMAERIFFFENVREDPINRPYFEGLDPVRKETLRRSMPFWEHYSDAFVMVCNKNGANSNQADYYGTRSMTTIRMGIDQAPDRIATYQAQLPRLEQAKADARQAAGEIVLERHGDELDTFTDGLTENRDEAAFYAVQHAREVPQLWETIKQDERLALTQQEKDAPANSLLRRAAVMLQTGKEQQQRNYAIMTAVRDISRTEDQVPSRTTYNDTRRKIAPLVQQILDCDVDAWKQMEPVELVEHTQALHTMADTISVLPDLLALKHPVQQDRAGASLTLHQDLVGQRLHELEYKCTTIQALNEKARALAILGKKWVDDEQDPLEAYLTEDELAQTQSPWKVPEQVLEDNLVASDQKMQQAAQKYHDIRTPGNPLCQQWLDDFFHQHSLEKFTILPTQFDAVIDEFVHSSDPVFQKARERIRDTNYKSLAYTPAQLKAANYPPDTGEKLLRGFETFLAMEAPQTLLTPDQLRQMLLDLGAGAGLSRTDDEKEPSPEVQQAIEQNNRGIAVYRDVLRGQFDMIARKYGNALERITLTNGLDHFADFGKDFADQQVTVAMAERYPGFFDLDQEEDVLLKHRINYYDALGTLVMYSYNMIQSGAMQTDEQLHTTMSEWLKQPAYAEARAYLEAHDPTFQHDRIDWTQRVQVPNATGAASGNENP